MAAAAILVVLTSVVTGFLGAALLSSYLYSRADAQLRDFGTIASRVLDRSHPPARRGGQQPSLPAQFLVEVVSAGGQVQRTETPLHDDGALRLSAAQLRDVGSPFTVPAHSWRVLVEPLSSGRHAVIAFSLDDLNSTVTRLEIADAVAGALAVAVLAGIGLPLVRASLTPLRRIEATAAAIAGGDLSRRIDHRSAGWAGSSRTCSCWPDSTPAAPWTGTLSTWSASRPRPSRRPASSAQAARSRSRLMIRSSSSRRILNGCAR
jgi:two-component system OmpR family sensor kinase